MISFISQMSRGKLAAEAVPVVFLFGYMARGRHRLAI